jgi:hypothetical protein
MWWKIVHNLESMFPSSTSGRSEDDIVDELQTDEYGKKLLMILGYVEPLIQQVRSSIEDYINP